VRYVVTGGTGFIGKHLLERLVRRQGEIGVVVRPRSISRFDELVTRLGEHGSQLKMLAGDITAEGLGLGPEDTAWCTGATVFHLGAIYDLAADDSVTETANVLGTKNVVGFANAVNAARLHHLSSIAVAGHYKGRFTEEMFAEGQDLDGAYFRTKYEAERIVRESANVAWRVYRPALVIGSSINGEAEKIDGPYYSFKLIQKMRDAFPSWMPFVGPEGRTLNIVPVDFVANAIDHIAHIEGLDNRAFHIVDPQPMSLGDTLNTFCRAAHAPEFALRFDSRMAKVVPGDTVNLIGQLPAIKRIKHEVLEGLGIPEAALHYINNPTTFDAAQTVQALEGSAIACPRLQDYAWKVWDWWERHMDPELPTPANIRAVVNKKVVVITGASSGIGRALAMKLATSGAVIIGVARGVERLEEMRAAVTAAGGEVHIYPTDLSSPDDCTALIRKVEAAHGRVDVLVNNAGRSIRRSIAESLDRFHDFERTMKLNYFGAVALVLAALPGMTERGNGHIINITSIGGQTYPPRFAAYVASKAALDAFSRCIASEIKSDGIDITTCHMPLVRTPMIAPTGIYKNFPTISPGEAAEMIAQAMITRPHEVSTRIGKFGELAHAVTPGVHQLLMSAAFSMLPDTAGRKSEGDGDEQPVSVEAYALSQLMRGIHL
jgi:NAD(P)-dependent dehydrogenase (short-subunit alcohol dehydrogenase family)